MEAYKAIWADFFKVTDKQIGIKNGVQVLDLLNSLQGETWVEEDQNCVIKSSSLSRSPFSLGLRLILLFGLPPLVVPQGYHVTSSSHSIQLWLFQIWIVNHQGEDCPVSETTCKELRKEELLLLCMLLNDCSVDLNLVLRLGLDRLPEQ